MPDGPEDHRDLVLRQAEVEAVEDAGAAELLDQVDDLDRVLATVVALAAGVEAVGIGLGWVDAGDDEVAPHGQAVLADVGAAVRWLCSNRLGGLGGGLRLRLELGIVGSGRVVHRS